MKGRETSFADLEWENKKHKTRREKLLERMEVLIPWEKILEQIRPYYGGAGKGRVPYPLESIVRVHFVQAFYGLSDPAMEDLLYEAESVRRFTGLEMSKLPDESTILNFRHLLERHGLGVKILETINSHLAEKGFSIRKGTIVDGSIIAAPSSTKNRERGRDPEMRQCKKGNQWHFGMKLHIGVDDESGIVHSMSTTAANVHDLTPSAELLHGEEERVWGDAGYQGIEKREEHRGRPVCWNIALRPSRRRTLARGSVDDLMERCKASVRAKVEHIFFYVKRMFGYDEVRYRGMAKNHNRLALLIGFANLLVASRCAVT